MPAAPASKTRATANLGFILLATALGLAAVSFLFVRSTRRSEESNSPGVQISAPASYLIRINERLVRLDATNVPFTGWMTEAYPGGSPKSRSQISNGVLHGISEGFYTNGVLQVREHFEHGVSHGPIAKWYPDGVPLSEGTARQGKLEGTFRRWHPNGQLAEEVTLQAGVPHGVSRAWFPSGSQKAEVELIQGKVEKRQFWEDGQRPPITTNASPGRER